MWIGERGTIASADADRASVARGLNLPDVVAAWLVCALVASITFVVSSDLHAPASASVPTAVMQPTPSNGEMLSKRENDMKTLFLAIAALAIAGAMKRCF